MRSRLRATFVAGVLAATTLAVAACGSDAGGGRSGKPAGEDVSLDLKIGDLVPLTGDLAGFGGPGRKAADVALAQIEKAAKQVGADHEVALLHEDTQTDPQSAVQAARKVVGEGASCIAGAWASAETIPVARAVTIGEGVAQVTLSTSDEITDLPDRGLVSRVQPADALQGPALANAIEQDLGGADGQTVNVGARNDAYGTGLADSFAAAWKEKGGKIDKQVIYDPGQPSYGAEAGELASGTPDAWVLIDFPETFSKVGPALVRSGGWDPAKTWVTDTLKIDSLPADVGGDATEGLRGTAPGVPTGEPAGKAFDRVYKAAPGPGRQTYDAQNFDAIMVCYLAAVAAASSDGEDIAAQVSGVTSPPGKKYTFEQLPAAIEALQSGKDIDYDGVSGALDIDDVGNPTSGVYDVFRYRGGKLDNVTQVKFSAAG